MQREQRRTLNYLPNGEHGGKGAGQWFERGTSRLGGDTLKRLADALDTISDYLLDGASDEADAPRVTDCELLRQFQAVEHLPDADKQVVKTLLDAFITKRQIENIIP